MALFPWKKSDSAEKTGGGSAAGGAGGAGGGAGGSAPGFEFDSGKAKRFFDHAVTMHEASNFGYAMNLWLKGLRFDPADMKGVEGFFNSAGRFFTENPKGEKDDSYRSAHKDFSGRNDLDKYLLGLLEWSAHPADAAYAVKALQGAAGLSLEGPSLWMAERVLACISRDKKAKKEQYLAVMEVFKKFDKLDRAVEAGEAAVRLDPTDSRLAADIKNMSAEWTTKRGGFDQTGQQGGFRANLRDADKQKRLDEQDRVVTTEEVMDRQVAVAKMDHETNPEDRPNVLKYIDVLIKRGRPEDEETAHALADKWHAKTSEFRFRETADTLKVRQAARRAARLKALAEQPGASEEARESAREAIRERVALELGLLEGQVAAYPTDVTRKFNLGKLYYQVKKYEEAIGLLQEAKSDVKNKAQVFFYLGLSFQQAKFIDEAIETLRQALTMTAESDEKAVMELQYGLMEALFSRAQEFRSLPDAEEANKIASSITIKNIGFKQIRQRRDEIRALIQKLKGGDVAAAGPGTSA